MQLGNFDAHRHTPIACKEQELAPRCGLEEASLGLRETERTLHSGRFRRSMTTEQHDRSVGRDHAALIGAEQILRVLRRNHE